MAVVNLFSKKQRLLNEQPSDILHYNTIPNALRVQIIHIINDGFGQEISTYGGDIEPIFTDIHDVLCREYGLFALNNYNHCKDRVSNFILQEPDIDRCLDAIDLCFKWIIRISSLDNYDYSGRRIVNAEDAVAELNDRFKEHAIGYQFENEIIRVDSTYVHSEIVKPTLQLLFDPIFSGANEEYLKAHEHYRQGRNKECLTECLKAFESTLKIISTNKEWAFNPNDTSSALLNLAFTNALIPSYLQTQFTSLRSLLPSGVPTIRNRLGGHGQGATPMTADDSTTRYALNLTGSSIIYLVELSGL